MNNIININVNLGNLTKEDKALFRSLIEKATKNQKIPNVADGETFEINGIEFIKFSDIDGITTAVAKNIAFKSDYGDNNNLANMNIIKRLEKEFLPKIIDAVGAENVLDFKTDLTTLDGVKTYGNITSKVSIPTFDFYREHIEIFDKFKLDEWYWLATPWSALPHYDSSCALCVSPSGSVYDDGYNYYCGVRPFLHFSSSIFESCDK